MSVLVVLRVAVVAALLALGMNTRLQDVTYLWGRPVLLAKSLLAMYVLVPLFAVVLVRGLALPPGTEVAMLVLAVCAGAPLIPRKLIKLGGDPDYVFSLMVITSLIAIVSVPVSLKVVESYLPFEPVVHPAAVAVLILKTFLLPLAAGMALRIMAPTIADRIDDRLLKVSGAALLSITLILLISRFELVLSLGWRSFFGFAAFSLGSLLTGHLLGGPSPTGRTSLAISCATRHVGLALLIAAGTRNDRALTIVAGYLLASAVVSVPYLRWRKRVHAPSDDDTALRRGG